MHVSSAETVFQTLLIGFQTYNKMNEKIKRIVVCCKWVCLVSGMICLTTGSSTKHWQGNDSSHEGLWEMCTKKFGCSSIKFKESKGILFY